MLVLISEEVMAESLRHLLTAILDVRISR